jgi:glycosyltransferase involved in cell wall biosynthesis
MKFSIVTPVYNGEQYIRETIESIINQQGSFAIELICVDNLSTDRTLKIIKNYQKLVCEKKHNIQCHAITIKVISEKDNGMYDAINKGFELATGDIYAWANSDDIYLPGAFQVVVDAFKRYKKVDWLKGVTSYIDEHSKITRIGRPYLYYRPWIRKGIYGRKLYFIQQSSTFWRSSLWKEVGGLNGDLKLAGDFDLWIKFSQKTKLYTLNYQTDCFRFRPGQLSKSLDKYHKECDDIMPLNAKVVNKLRLFKKLSNRIPSAFKPFAYFLIFGYQCFYLIDINIYQEMLVFRLKSFNYYFYKSVLFD